MTTSQAIGSDFLQLDPTGVPRGERSRWLADAFRSAMADGRLQVGARLPATRALAQDLGFARGTVEEAYRRLTEEGLLQANRGAGTAVAARPSGASARSGVPAHRTAIGSAAVLPTAADGRLIDLSSGVPDLSAFPRAAWLRAERRVLDTATAGQLGYAPPQGVPELRAELAGWLARSRGVEAAPEQIVITGGVTGALSLLYQVLRRHGRTVVALEDPGPDGNRRILRHWANPVLPVPVDDQGIDVAALRRVDPDVVVLTPAHQYPTGVVLSADRRRQLVGWARSSGALIIEDDYDAEYRYDRTPVRAMQPLAPDLIAYTASLSKILAPALRLGWLVPPPELLPELIDGRWATDLGSPALPQLVLAELLRNGAMARHLRSMRARHRTRRDAAVEAVAAELPGCRIRGIAAGIHLLIDLPPDTDDVLVAYRARSAGVLVQPLSMHRITAGPPGLVLTYANQAPAVLRSAIARIGGVLSRG